MVSHSAHTRFERAGWRLGLLVYGWTLQMLLTMSLMGLFIWRLARSVEDKAAAPAWTIQLVCQVVNIAASLGWAMGAVFEITRFVAQALTPRSMLIAHVLKMACAFVIGLLDAVTYARCMDASFLAGLGLALALLMLAGVIAMYAYTAYRRVSQFEDCLRHANIDSYGLNDPDPPRYFASSLSRNSLDKRSMERSRRVSTGSTGSDESVGLRIMGRYNHERDTRFDEYLAQRRAFDVASGLERSRSRLSQRNKFHAGSYGPLMGSGAIKGYRRARRARVIRGGSYSSDHVLLAVPEEEEAEAEADEAASGLANDETTLLGNRLPLGEADVAIAPASLSRPRG